MRKASKILFLIGGIVAIVAAVVWLIWGIVLFILPNTEAFEEAIKQAMKENPDVSEELLRATLQGTLIGGGVSLIFETVCCALSSFFAFKAYKQEKPSTALCVLNIVFGALSVEVNLVGAIFALIANGQDERRELAQKQE